MPALLSPFRTYGHELLVGVAVATAIGLVPHGIAATSGDGDDTSLPADDAVARGRKLTAVSAVTAVGSGAALGAAALTALVGKPSTAVWLVGSAIGFAGTAATVTAMRGAVDIGFGNTPELPPISVRAADQ